MLKSSFRFLERIPVQVKILVDQIHSCRSINTAAYLQIPGKTECGTYKPRVHATKDNIKHPRY